MRKLVLDTETSGLNPENDRIIELACVEMINESPTGEKYHRYYNPGDIIISNEAEQIHGLNNKFLENSQHLRNQRRNSLISLKILN